MDKLLTVVVIAANVGVLLCTQCTGKDEVLDGQTCINVAECKKPIVFQRECLDICPEGYVYDVNLYNGNSYNPEYNTHKLSDLDERPCIKRNILVIQVVVVTMVTVFYILFIIAFFSMKSFSFSSMKGYCLLLCRRKKKSATSDGDERNDEEMIHAAGNHVDIDDENMLL